MPLIAIIAIAVVVLIVLAVVVSLLPRASRRRQLGDMQVEAGREESRRLHVRGETRKAEASHKERTLAGQRAKRAAVETELHEDQAARREQNHEEQAARRNQGLD